MAFLLPDICRLCADKKDSLIEVTKRGENSELAENIENYLPVEVKELGGVTFKICEECKYKIEEWNCFFQQVFNVQAFLDPVHVAVFEYLVERSLDNIDRKSFCEKLSSRQFALDVLAGNEPVESDSEEQPGNLVIDLDGPNSVAVATPSEAVPVEERTEHVTETQNAECDVPKVDKRRRVYNRVNSQSDKENKKTTPRKYKSSKNASPGTKPKKPKESYATRPFWNCHLCGLNVPSWIALIKHCNQMHKARPQYNCSCGETAFTRDTIKDHFIAHDPDAQFKCDTCGKSFPFKALLRTHILGHLPKSQRPFKCPVCPSRFHRKTVLVGHVKTHLPKNQKLVFTCRICDMKFGRKGTLETHYKNKHLHEKPYGCPKCGRSFACKRVLEEHIPLHNNMLRFKCGDCGEHFETRYRLILHADTHLNKVYICAICNASLKSRQTLVAHLKVHDQITKINCDVCGKGFKRTKDLAAHKILHTGKKPYSCQFCKKTFSNGPNCRAHKLRHHKEKLERYEEMIAKKGIKIRRT